MIQLPNEPAPGAPLSANWAKQVVRCLRALTPRESATVRPNTNTGGTIYEVKRVPARGGSATAPWDVATETESDTLYGKVNPGYLAGNAPTMNDAVLGVTPIDADPAPRLEMTGSGTEHFYLKLATTLTSANDFVYRETFASAVIEVAGTVPANNLAAGIYHLRLATFVDGVKQSPQPVLNNLSYFIADTLLGASEAECTFVGV